MQYSSIEQQIVVECKVKGGYSILGVTKSIVNGVVSVVLVKGIHTLVINSLGYDEHYKGKTWMIYE
jgi:hypothetical protein